MNTRMKQPKLPIAYGSDFSVAKAHALQKQLANLVACKDTLPKTITYVAGVDVAYTKRHSIGAVATLDYKTLSVSEVKTAKVKTCFPYIPTLLSFREIPPVVAAVKKLRKIPDVFLVDGQGIAHPYRLGFASHLGLTLNMPTIGVAKSLLCGKIGASNRKGWAPILDDAEVIGAAVAKDDRRPVYVSIGHKVSLQRAIDIVRHCSPRYRIPEPIRVAHRIANEKSKDFKK